jgi:hypothetical protein
VAAGPACSRRQTRQEPWNNHTPGCQTDFLGSTIAAQSSVAVTRRPSTRGRRRGFFSVRPWTGTWRPCLPTSQMLLDIDSPTHPHNCVHSFLKDASPPQFRSWPVSSVVCLFIYFTKIPCIGSCSQVSLSNYTLSICPTCIQDYRSSIQPSNYAAAAPPPRTPSPNAAALSHDKRLFEGRKPPRLTSTRP